MKFFFIPLKKKSQKCRKKSFVLFSFMCVISYYFKFYFFTILKRERKGK